MWNRETYGLLFSVPSPGVAAGVDAAELLGLFEVCPKPSCDLASGIDAAFQAFTSRLSNVSASVCAVSVDKNLTLVQSLTLVQQFAP